MAKPTTTTPAVPVNPSIAAKFAAAAESMMTNRKDVTAIDIAASVLEAPDLDSILGSEVIGLSDIIGKPFTIDEANLNKSDYDTDAGLGVYVIMHAHYDNGEKAIISSGATSVVAQVIRMVELGVLPARVVGVKASKPTEQGYYPIRLGKPEQGF